MELVQAVFYPAFVVAMAVAILLFIPAAGCWPDSRLLSWADSET